MGKQLGSFIVLFKPGVVTGIHNENEVVQKDICVRLGGLDCKIFDPYLTYSKLADDGLLVRFEQRNGYGCSAVSFFYPSRDLIQIRPKLKVKIMPVRPLKK